uniref:Uncharacterized protein n=1 Tax=Anguilla anguilla TaxID=7936 RepID=A0A0E9T3J5_ANGAN
MEDGSSVENLEVSRQVLSGYVPRNSSNLIGWHFILQQDNDPKHIAFATEALISGEKVESFWTGQVSHLI